MSGRTFKHQPRASKEGWTNAHEHLIHLYVAFGLKSEGTALLKHTKLISNKCAFPDTLAYYARDRKQGYLQKKGKRDIDRARVQFTADLPGLPVQRYHHVTRQKSKRN